MMLKWSPLTKQLLGRETASSNIENFTVMCHGLIKQIWKSLLASVHLHRVVQVHAGEIVIDACCYSKRPTDDMQLHNPIDWQQQQQLNRLSSRIAQRPSSQRRHDIFYISNTQKTRQKNERREGKKSQRAVPRPRTPFKVLPRLVIEWCK